MWQAGALPEEVVHLILLFDPRFKLRDGQIVSIIPKDDERYKILHTITRTRTYIHYKYEWILPNRFRLQYALPNIIKREPYEIEGDMIDVGMDEKDDTLFYEVTIYRLKKYNPAESYMSKLQYRFQRK
uniref:Uncharacterized protein n=1 Tax=viral metagenome TaxID=1070528 RepID=A0A6C0I4S7_9ZZZZ